MSEFDGKALADKNGDTLRFTPTHFLDGNTVKELASEFGKKLDKTGDGKDVTVTFSQASSRGTAANDFASGSSLATLFGKMKKWFASLGALAFKDSVSGTEIGSHSHSTGDVSGLDNALNGLGSSIGSINAALEHKASDDHTHSTLVDHESNSGSVALQWSGASISSVTPTGSNTKASTKYLVAIYLDNGIPVFKDVQAGNVTVAKANEADSATNADKVDGYHILVNQTVTARTDAIFFL